MGRNKFEKQLKEHLKDREIKPSEEAWERISQQLEVSNTPKSKNFKWYGIAAGFIGLIFISVWYFTMRGLSADNDTQITNVKKDTILSNKTPEIICKSKVEEDRFIGDGKVQGEKSIQSKNKRNTDTPKKDALVSSKAEERKVEKTPAPLNPSKEFIDIKIAEIVAQVALLESENSTVTDAEIDSLLRGAQRQLLEDKIFRNDRSVDAMALLADVEDELDTSFRDQIFDALKDVFLKVRTAVADRNK